MKPVTQFDLAFWSLMILSGVAQVLGEIRTSDACTLIAGIILFFKIIQITKRTRNTDQIDVPDTSEDIADL